MEGAREGGSDGWRAWKAHKGLGDRLLGQVWCSGGALDMEGWGSGRGRCGRGDIGMVVEDGKSPGERVVL